MSGVGLDGAKGVLPRASSSSMAQRPTRETEKGRGQQRSSRPVTTITSSTTTTRPATTTGTSSVTSKTQQTDGKRGERRKVKSKNVGEALKAKEERYRRLNEELEAKTASLVREAEEIMKENISFVSEDSVVLSSGEEEEKEEEEKTRSVSVSQTVRAGVLVDDRPAETTQQLTATTFQQPKVEQTRHIRQTTSSSRRLSSKNARGGGGEQSERSKHTRRSKGERSEIPVGAQDVVGDIPSSLTDDIERTVRELEEKLAHENMVIEGHERGDREVLSHFIHHRGDDIIPEVAEEMGAEALMRFMKAKLRVLQEEVDRLSAENISKDKQLTSAEARLKEYSEENAKLKQNHHSMQLQMNKYKQLSVDMQHKTEGLEAQLVALRREIDSMKAAQRKASSGHSAVEVRLNRAMEEVEKYKTELRKAQADSKEMSKQERQRVEELMMENKRLDHQKSELITAFKKQVKLIDILKRQKLHIEAARLLSFTEEEFIKSLNWDMS